MKYVKIDKVSYMTLFGVFNLAKLKLDMIRLDHNLCKNVPKIVKKLNILK